MKRQNNIAGMLTRQPRTQEPGLQHFTVVSQQPKVEMKAATTPTVLKALYIAALAAVSAGWGYVILRGLIGVWGNQ